METIRTKLCNIHNISLTSALSQVKKMSQSKKLDIIVTPNIDHLVRLCNEKNKSTLREIYRTASLCLCDSNIFEKLLYLKGNIIKEVVPGSTLTQQLFDKVITKNDDVLVIGGSNGTIDKLRAQYNHLNISHYNPSMGFIDKPEEVQKIMDISSTLCPNYIFLAVGSPRQEILASKLIKETLTKGVVLCIGASILFIVGEEKRAPLWLQKLHCEWLYRMLNDPKRLIPRYANNLIQLPKVFKSL